MEPTTEQAVTAASAVSDNEVLLMTYLQVAKRLNISRTTVYQLIAEGRLTPVHIGRSARIATAEFERFIADLGLKTAPKTTAIA